MRYAVENLENLIGKKIDVAGGGGGFVRVVDYLGSDESIVQAARVSYGKGTKSVSEDRGLIRYMMRHRHTSPFEMCEIKLHVKVPMDVWRQWIRHRTASVSEYSTRYSEAIDEMAVTPVTGWRRQAKDNKQGSSVFFEDTDGMFLSADERDLQNHARSVYQKRLQAGVAREQARKDLPLSTYTEAYWKIDLHNLLHFLQLRMDSHAQWEIRQYAQTIGWDIVSQWTPLTWEAFLDYRFYAISLSKVEQRWISTYLRTQKWPVAIFELPHLRRERAEFRAKLERLGILCLSWDELEEKSVSGNTSG